MRLRDLVEHFKFDLGIARDMLTLDRTVQAKFALVNQEFRYGKGASQGSSCNPEGIFAWLIHHY